jgi:predicted permease
MLLDLRQTIRRLLQAPGFALVAVLTLALGIGVNATMLGLVDALLFRGAPFPTRAALVQLTAALRQGGSRPFSYAEIEEIRPHAAAFASLLVLGRESVALAEPGRPAERILAANVSDGFAETFGVAPLLGRAFTPEEFRPGANNVVLLSHAFWLQRFGADRDVLGRTLRLDGATVEIVGVMPPSFDYRPLWGGAAYWRPLEFTPEQREWRDNRVFTLVGRLRDGARPAQAEAGFATLAAEQAKTFPESYTGLRYRAEPLEAALTDRQSRQITLLLLGLSAFVLLLACANLANLQLARATGRLREFAIRAALGASRRRLLAGQLIESVVLALAGAALGLLFAGALGRFLSAHLGIGGAEAAGLGAPVLGATFFVALLSGALFGLVPAWFAARADVNAALKQQSRGSTGGPGHHRMRQSLIVAEVGLAFVLLAGAVMMHRGVAKLSVHPAGWDTERVLIADLPLPDRRINTDEKRIDLFRRLERRLAQIPGVEHAAIATSLPLDSYSGERQVLIDGQSPADAARMPSAFHVMVTADYFATLGIKLVQGRPFEPGMPVDRPRVVIVNESLARRLWPEADPIGRRLGAMDSGMPFWAEVIGVVRDVDAATATRDPNTPYQVYKPLEQEPWSWSRIALRCRAPAGIEAALRRAVSEVDPDLAVASVATVREIAAGQQRDLHLAGRILGGFSLLGITLAAVGLYGVISHVVAQRRAEFGIRLALGASPAGIARLVLGHGLRFTLLGVGLGLAASLALAQMLRSMLPRLEPGDPLLLALVSAALVAVAMVSCWIPVRRATRVDPMVALRAE